MSDEARERLRANERRKEEADVVIQRDKNYLQYL